MDNNENLTAAEKIQGALVECLKEKIKLDELTIAELSKRAGVGKSTFYRHYKDIYDVYEQLVDGFMVVHLYPNKKSSISATLSFL